MFGKLFKNVKVLSVKDSSGNSVFKNKNQETIVVSSDSLKFLENYGMHMK